MAAAAQRIDDRFIFREILMVRDYKPDTSNGQLPMIVLAQLGDIAKQWTGIFDLLIL